MAKHKENPSSFSGDLWEPITLPHFFSNEWDDEITKIRRNRFAMLLGWYGVADTDPDKWRKLSWRMACELVPGMTVAESTPRGRRPVWTIKNKKELVEYIDAIREQQGLSVEKAIKQATATTGKYAKSSPQSLTTRYFEARNSLNPPTQSGKKYTLLD